MDEENQAINDEIDEVLDWMVDVMGGNSNESIESDSIPNIDPSQIEVGITETHLDYVTDGTNWVWFD